MWACDASLAREFSGSTHPTCSKPFPSLLNHPSTPPCPSSLNRLSTPPLPLGPLQLSQVQLQARGREHARLTSELEAVQSELQAFVGLPADPDAARAATATKRAELERLRRQLREHLDGLAAA